MFDSFECNTLPLEKSESRPSETVLSMKTEFNENEDSTILMASSALTLLILTFSISTSDL